VRYIKFSFPFIFINLVANNYFTRLIINHNKSMAFYFKNTFSGNCQHHVRQGKHHEQTRNVIRASGA
ncbi:hypothetical protein Q4R04_10265, partial [Morganella morganii]